MRQNDLQQRFIEQEQELQVHQAELQQQNEELRQINLELELAHNRYADLFEFAPVGYVVCSEHGLIQDINRTGSDQLGALRPHLVGRPFALFLEAGQRAAFTALLSQVVQSGGCERHPRRMEARMVSQDGRPWDAQLDCTSLIARGGLVARIVLTDVSDLKNAQRDAARRTTEAKLLSDELQTFLHALTHDLTRPQRQVEAFAGLLAASLQSSLQTPDEKSARHLRHLLQAASDMGALTDSLTRFFQSGQPVGEGQTLDLNRVIEVLFHETQFQCQRQGQLEGRQLTLTHDQLPTIQADRQNVQIVFTALIGNAVKFTRPRAEARVHVGYQEGDETHLFSVRDNGVGFDTGQAGRLFKVFERLHSDREFEGLGLGLALVRRVVERGGGRVWAESVPGEGATFWIQLLKAPSRERKQ
ncbi:sensor histidine kinase [Deinococcus altitudinis]|uniref:sensor histidine kinase n=1 Tax=Deinococcus altitudinis TaxID=468914 RepID=UPI003891AC0C